ncbi:MAG: hypothetical protein ABI946_06725, partial [Chthoniobacterales bacterium]
FREESVAPDTVATCADTFKQCMETSTNAFYQCKSTGRDPAACEQEKAKREETCMKKKEKCESDNPAQKGTSKPKPKK